jgi:hypothetical protein
LVSVKKHRTSVDTYLVRKRLVAIAILAVVISGASIWTAVALPPACPGGFHPRQAACLSDATHIAPSSGVRIPVATTAYDSRVPLRIGIGLGGVLIAAVLVLAARPKRGPQPLLA